MAALVEPGLRHHATNMLQQCRLYKDRITSLAVNWALFAVFIGTAYITLKYKAKHRPPHRSPDDQEKARREFMMRALGRSSETHNPLGPITGLPGFTSGVRLQSST
jgi:hypothetical protein